MITRYGLEVEIIAFSQKANVATIRYENGAEDVCHTASLKADGGHPEIVEALRALED